MKQTWITLLTALSLLIAGPAMAEIAVLKPYSVGEWKSVTKTANGSPLAVHFWGATCPACVKEMPQWGHFLKTHPKAKVIFIQVDDVSAESMQKMLAKAGLDQANNYYVASPFDERMRYEIDPKWHGETPTTFLIDTKGAITRKTGLMNFKQLEKSLMSL